MTVFNAQCLILIISHTHTHTHKVVITANLQMTTLEKNGLTNEKRRMFIESRNRIWSTLKMFYESVSS